MFSAILLLILLSVLQEVLASSKARSPRSSFWCFLLQFTVSLSI